MKYEADHFYKKGSSHHFCEDFASSCCPEHGGVFAIISDGCSSAQNSTVAAMLLTKSMEKKMKRPSGLCGELLASMAIHEAHVYWNNLDLNFNPLCATLLVAYREKSFLKAVIVGDGVVVAKRRDGVFEITEIEYTSGAPYYPVYSISQENQDQYLSEFPGECIIRTSRSDKPEDVQQTISPVGALLGMRPFEYQWSIKEYELVAVMSDGVQTFYEETEDRRRLMIPLQEVTKELFDFKRYSPNFVKRRMQKAFRAFTKKGWDHLDDFSIGVVTAEI